MPSSYTEFISLACGLLGKYLPKKGMVSENNELPYLLKKEGKVRENNELPYLLKKERSAKITSCHIC